MQSKGCVAFCDGHFRPSSTFTKEPIMTDITFDQLPKLAEQMTALILDSGGSSDGFDLATVIPDNYVAAAYIIEGFLTAVADRTLGDYFTTAELHLIMDQDVEPASFDVEESISEPMGEILCHSSDLCHALISGDRRIVSENIRLIASIIHPFMESVFEGEIYHLIDRSI
jgi:hypothetical protein